LKKLWIVWFVNFVNMFFFGLCFALSHASEATYHTACDLGDGYNVMSQTCTSRNFDNYENVMDCDDENAGDEEYCIEQQADNTAQTLSEQTVSTTAELDNLLGVMASVSGTGWGAEMSATANYISTNVATTNAVSFVKTASGDSYIKKIKNPENLKLTATAKAKLEGDLTGKTFVEAYGTHFISKIIYSNHFIASVNVQQSSDQSYEALNVVASISADDLYQANGEVDLETSSDFTYLSKDWQADYNGPTKYVARDGVSGTVEELLDVYSQWLENVNDASDNEQYAKPTRMVFERWTVLEEVQALFPDGFPEILTSDTPSSTIQEYLHLDTIRTNADKNAINNLMSWSCIGGASSNLYQDLLAVEASRGAHQDELEAVDEAKIVELQEQIAGDEGLTWFTGLTGAHIAKVNDLLLDSGKCSHGETEYKQEFTIFPWGLPRWGPITNKLRFPDVGVDETSNVLLRGFGFAVNDLKITHMTMIGETIGYQTINDGYQVNGGSGHKTSYAVNKHYAGGSEENIQNFELTCAKDGMYVTGIHVDWSEVICGCAGNPDKNSGWNQRQCTDGSVDWCDCGTQYCNNDEAVLKKNADDLCTDHSCGRRRVEDRFPEVLRRRNADPDGKDFGRLISMTLHCDPLPVGTYGLAGSETNHGWYSLNNVAGTRAENHCPEGSAIHKVNWIAYARAKNDGTQHDAIWTVASRIRFRCRNFADFLAA